MASEGGQTPIFHAVNSISNYCRPTMEDDAGATTFGCKPFLGESR